MYKCGMNECERSYSVALLTSDASLCCVCFVEIVCAGQIGQIQKSLKYNTAASLAENSNSKIK